MVLDGKIEFDLILRYFNPSLRISKFCALFVTLYILYPSPLLSYSGFGSSAKLSSAVPFVLHIGHFKFVCPLQIIIAGCFVVEQWTAAYLFSTGFQLVPKEWKKDVLKSSNRSALTEISFSTWMNLFSGETKNMFDKIIYTG